MFPRFLIKSIAPLRLSTRVAAYSKQYSFQSANRIITIVSSTNPHRLYSVVPPNPEELVVDYDYVKNATSNNSILLVDVREPDEIKEHGKIPNSINIPLGDVTTVLSTMPDKEFEKTYQRSKPTEDSQIVFYCMIGKRSGMAQQNAINVGFKNVKNYLGSWTDWAAKSQS